MRRVTNEIKKQIIKLKKQGVPIIEMCKKLSVSDSTIDRYSKGIVHPNKSILIKLTPKSKRFSIEKAEILGYLCSEGNDNDINKRYFTYDKKRGKFYYSLCYKKWINFSNTNKVILGRFIFLMNKVYSYPLKAFKNGTIHIKRKEVVMDLRCYTLFGSRRWKLPRILFLEKYRPHTFRFLRAYFDGDGTISSRQVRVDSINYHSLKEVHNLLNKLLMKAEFHVYSSRNRIAIKDIKRYYKTIGFLHPEKKEKLKELVLRS